MLTWALMLSLEYYKTNDLVKGQFRSDWSRLTILLSLCPVLMAIWTVRVCRQHFTARFTSQSQRSIMGNYGIMSNGNKSNSWTKMALTLKMLFGMFDEHWIFWNLKFVLVTFFRKDRAEMVTAMTVRTVGCTFILVKACKRLDPWLKGIYSFLNRLPCSKCLYCISLVHFRQCEMKLAKWLAVIFVARKMRRHIQSDRVPAKSSYKVGGLFRGHRNAKLTRVAVTNLNSHIWILISRGCLKGLVY